jgi:endonuclease IV
MSATFGPAGNSESFYAEKHKSTLEAPAWLRARGLDAYEYSAGNGITGSIETFRKLGLAAKENGIRLSLHTPYYISLSGVEEEKRLKSLTYIKKSISLFIEIIIDTRFNISTPKTFNFRHCIRACIIKPIIFPIISQINRT